MHRDTTSARLITVCKRTFTHSFQAGLDVMLSVPRQANDEMSISLIRGYDVSTFEGKTF